MSEFLKKNTHKSETKTISIRVPYNYYQKIEKIKASAKRKNMNFNFAELVMKISESELQKIEAELNSSP